MSSPKGRRTVELWMMAVQNTDGGQHVTVYIYVLILLIV